VDATRGELVEAELDRLVKGRSAGEPDSRERKEPEAWVP
jgi:hypothetical protein